MSGRVLEQHATDNAMLMVVLYFEGLGGANGN